MKKGFTLNATAKKAPAGVKVEYTGWADIRILPAKDLADKAGTEHERFVFNAENDHTVEVPQAVADWLVANDAFKLAE